MTAAQHNPLANATTANVERTTGIRYLFPTPPDCQPEIDYFASLQNFAETRTDYEKAQFAKSLLEPSDPEYGIVLNKTKVCEVTSSGSTECLSSCTGAHYASVETTNARIYKGIHEIRQKMKDSHDQPRVLIVEDANRATLQALGAALDLNPSFLLRHAYDSRDDNVSYSGANALDQDYDKFRRQEHDHIDQPSGYLATSRHHFGQEVHIRSLSSLTDHKSIRISCLHTAYHHSCKYINVSASCIVVLSLVLN